MERETIIIDVQVNADEVAKNLSKTTAEIARLKAEQKSLAKEIKAGADVNGDLSASYAANAQRLRELTATEKTYTSQLNSTTEVQRKYQDSIYGLSAQLTDLKNIYRGLSKEDREGAAGIELKEKIQDLDKEIKGLDADLGDHQRNVGNYVSALTGLDSRVVKVAAVFQGGFKQGLQSAGAALKSFGKALLTTPLGWIAAAVAAAVAVFNKLRDAFKRNDDASTELSAAMAKLQPIATAISKIFDGLATAVAKVVGGIMSAVSWIGGKLSPAFKEASDAAEELVRSEDKLEDKQREYTIASAERQKEISELNKKARSDDSLTAKEKEDLYKKIDDLERQDLEDRKNIAAENLRIIEQRYAQEVNTSDEAKDAITAARAEMLKAETDYNNATVRFAQRQANALKEQVEEEKRRHEEWKKRLEERKSRTKEAIEALQDIETEFIKDETQRQLRQLNLRYDREIESLKEQLKKKDTLTEEAEKAIIERINLLRKKQAEEAAKISEDEIRKRVDKEKQEWEKLTDLKFSLMKDDTERAIEQAKERANREIMELNRRLEEEENLTEGARKAINEQIILLEQIKNEEIDKINKEAIEKRLKAEEEARQQELELLKKSLEEKKQAFDKATNDIVSSAHTINDAMVSLYNSIAGDNERYEQFRKAMAIVDATINMAKAIAEATAISLEGEPYTVAARIATNVAAVTSTFAALIAAIKSATVPSAPKFAQGGIVEGASLTGDRVHVMANAGEMIINREDQRKLFDMIKAGGIGDYSLMRAAFSEALREMPSPVLDYSEFTGFQRSVKMVEKRTKLI